MISEQRREQYKTLLILCAGFALIGWRLHLRYLIIGAAVVFVLSLLSGYILEKVTDAWMWIGEKIGAVMSRVILSVVFVFFLTPVAVIYRLSGAKNKGSNKMSYFKDRNHTYTAEDMEKIF